MVIHSGSADSLVPVDQTYLYDYTTSLAPYDPNAFILLPTPVQFHQRGGTRDIKLVMQGRLLVTRWVNVQSPNNPTDRREVFVGIQPYCTHQCLDSGCESSATGILLSRVCDNIFR